MLWKDTLSLPFQTKGSQGFCSQGVLKHRTPPENGPSAMTTKNVVCLGARLKNKAAFKDIVGIIGGILI